MIKAVTIHSMNKPDVQKEWWEDYEYRTQFWEGVTPQYFFSLPYAYEKKLVITEDKNIAQLLQSTLDTLTAKKKDEEKQDV